MKRLGILLAVEPNAGGMFQYAQSVLEALSSLQASDWQVEAAYVSALWEPILAIYPFGKRQLAFGPAGLGLANIVMASRMPGPIARAVTMTFNPLAHQLRRAACDLWIFPAQDALTYQVNLTTVGTIHDLMHRYEPSFPEVSDNGRFALREHRFANIASWSQAVLVDSELGRRHALESYNVDPEKVHSLPYIPPKHISAAEPTDFDQRYLLPEKFIFYPAQFWSHKNHHRLLDAASKLISKHSDLCLVFTGGDGPLREEVYGYTEQLGMLDHVVFQGYVPDEYLSGFYRRARAMMMPTFFGPTNIPPLEAFRCECACAISNNYAMPEQARGAALEFNPKSTDEIADAMDRLWSDDSLVSNLVKRGQVVSETWTQRDFNARLAEILHLATKEN